MDLSGLTDVPTNYVTPFQPTVKNVNFDCQLSDNFGYVYTVQQVKEVQTRWQALTASKFVCIKTTKGYGKNGKDQLTTDINYCIA